MPLFGKTAQDVSDDLLEKMSFGQEEGVGTAPFYAVKARETVYLPEDIIKYFTGSNGMAAGNSLEEAIVQGLSEIFERYVQLQMIENKIVPPEIPREEVARFPLVASIIEEIEKKERYRVFVMDCSLGKGLPVVCGGVIDTEKQTLGLKFGSHPDLGVALERVFSEAMQGKPLDRFVQMNVPNFTSPSHDVMNRHHNSFNMLKIGMGDIPSWLLYDEPSYAFTPWQDVDSMGNNELMHSMLRLLGGMCNEVYIRDMSYLGFPTVWIYVPAISEITEVDTYNLKISNMRTKTQAIFLHLDTATDEEVQQLLRCAIAQCNSFGENTINVLSGIEFTNKMPFADLSEAAFLAAVCFYRLGNLNDAARILRSCTNLSGYDYAATTYLRARAQGATHTEVAQVLGKLCQPHIANKVLDDFSDPKTVLSKVYPVCRGLQCNKCSAPCSYRSLEDFYTMLANLELESGLGAKALEKLFQN
jgi:ribosomal protein S12 methylthiotransferase accessory factor